MKGRGEEELESQTSQGSSTRRTSMGGGTSGSVGGASMPRSDSQESGLGRKTSGRRIRDFVKGLTTTSSDKEKGDEDNGGDGAILTAADGSRVEAIEAKSGKALRRVLYTANVGDARAVLWYSLHTCLSFTLILGLSRGGKAVRLTYDHKGSDTQEAKRITDAGGFVMNNRVNGGSAWIARWVRHD